MTRPALLLAALLCSTPALADTLVNHVNGVQVTPAGGIEHFTGLLVGDDGRVKRVLHGELLKLPGSTKVIDGGGRTMLPGLIDAHGHVMELGASRLQLDVTGTRSVAELQARLKAYAAAHPELPWIVGRGWNQELWADKRFPTAADLDAVVRDRPVWLGRVDGHAAVGNSAALRAAGVTAATATPSGGRIDKDASGRPTGLFVDAATGLVERAVPAATPAQRRAALLAAQADLLSKGVTAAADMGTPLDDWHAMRSAYGEGALKVRIMSYAMGPDNLKAIAAEGQTGWSFGDRLKLNGIKLYADGALGSRGAYLKQPYADAPTRGLALLTPAQLKAEAGVAASGGWQIAVHAIGDAANNMVLTAYEQLGSARGDRRWRVEHAQILDPADLPRFARDKVIASMQPTHETSDRLMAQARLGPKRLAGAYAWQTLTKSGARLALGSDFPVEDPNPFPGLAAAVSRQGLDDQPPGGWRPWEKLTFAQALAGFTRWAAWAGFAEGRYGSLEPGKWADFILVDRPVDKVSAHDMARTQVEETWIAGERVWARNQPAR
ncbi:MULTISPECIES: amidohydrolase [Sphingomonas]|uniref:amidohydrolase n=1 Tax=Sphingomonas TaxID=13687 RepID=UPI000DEFB33D|nr:MULTISPECIES: amidohydrolase [Sphingomonas]